MAPQDDSVSEEYRAVQNGIRTLAFAKESEVSTSPATASAISIWKQQMRGSLVAGFQMAVRAGPVCEEPVRGVLVVLEGMEVAVKEADTGGEYKCAKPLSGGMVAAALRSGIRCALL